MRLDGVVVETGNGGAPDRETGDSGEMSGGGAARSKSAVPARMAKSGWAESKREWAESAMRSSSVVGGESGRDTLAMYGAVDLL